MTPLESAIALLEAEVEAFQQGTKFQPAEKSEAWFVLRAKALGLSHLRRMAQLRVHDDPAAAERFYRGCQKTFKSLGVPDEVIVEKELLEPAVLVKEAIPT